MNKEEFYAKLQQELTNLTLHVDLGNDDYADIRIFDVVKDKFGREILAYTNLANDLIKDKENAFIDIEKVKNLEIKK